MNRRYYRYNDPTPGTPFRKPSPPVPPTPSKPSSVFSLNTLFANAAKDDLLLIGVLLLIVLGEDKSEIDFPLMLALIYLLLQK